MARRRRRAVRAALASAFVVVVVIGAAVFTGFFPECGHEIGRTDAAPAASGPDLTLPQPPAVGPVLGGAATTPTLSVRLLEKRLSPVLGAKGIASSLGLEVADLDHPDITWSHGHRSVTPASNLKLLTTTAALAALGPEHRFTTSVVDGATTDSIVLVGGGDPLLVARRLTGQDATATYPQPASLQELAARAAAALKAHGTSQVHVSYDDALFDGPTVNPHWPSTYISEDVVSPISALWINEGRDHYGFAARSAHPAASAAAAFADLLDKDGVKVVGSVQSNPSTTLAVATDAAAQSVLSGQTTLDPTSPPPAPPSSTNETALGSLVASVASPSLAGIVQHILQISDNEGAEVLLRQVALAAGAPGSFEAGVVAVRSMLTGLGLDLSGAVFYDGSGLSRDDLVPVGLLVHVFELDCSPAHPRLRAVIEGLPVAGFSGSLADRFAEAPNGLGYVRAKTGTLTGVDALAGIAMTRSGTPLVFVANADRVPVALQWDAMVGLDRVAAAIASCGCSR